MSLENFILKDRPLVIAHRGDPSQFPENSLQAMKAAVDLNVDVLETDVRLTKDNELVIFHDETLKRITDLEGKVKDYSLDELKTARLGYNFTTDNGKTYPYRGKNYQIPTLKEFFDEIPNIKINIDIKDTEPIAVEILAQIISEYQELKDKIWIGSFHPAQIYYFRKIMPQVLTGASSEEIRKFLVHQKLHSLFRVKPTYHGFQVPMKHEETEIITSTFIKQAHKKKLAVMVWTINESLTMDLLIELGVDGIFTDNPKLLIQVLKNKGINIP